MKAAIAATAWATTLFIAYLWYGNYLAANSPADAATAWFCFGWTIPLALTILPLTIGAITEEK